MAMAALPPPPSPLLPNEQKWRDVLCPLIDTCRHPRRLKELHALSLRTSPLSSSPGRDLAFLYSRLLHSSAYSDNPAYADNILRHLLLLADVADDGGDVFVRLPDSASFFYNTLIRAHARSPDRHSAALELFVSMLDDGRVRPDKHTFPFVLRACAHGFRLKDGAPVHGLAVKLGLAADVFVANSLIHFYGSCGRVGLAARVFDRMPDLTRVSWNAAIEAVVGSGRLGAALEMVRDMQAEFEPDGFTLQSLVRACQGLGALDLGMWAHAFWLRRRSRTDPTQDLLISNSLVGMYAGCGSLSLARQVFDEMPKRNLASWNNLILGLAAHGEGEEAVETLERMVREGVEPDGVTFVGVLSACAHRGLVGAGRAQFAAMVAVHGVEPRLEHYGCMVDLLARAGLVEEALELVSEMPFEPDAVIWRSLLDACWKAGLEPSESMTSRVLTTEEEESDRSSGGLVLLSRFLASAKRWGEVGLVRKMMSERGVRKEPGCSSIEIGGNVHEFLAG